MSTISISQACELVWDLLQALEDTYWEASTLSDKDQVFNVLQSLNAEYMELLKVSVQDHHYPYEVISTNHNILKQTLSDFKHIAGQLTRRQHTSARLNALLDQLNHSLVGQ